MARAAGTPLALALLALLAAGAATGPPPACGPAPPPPDALFESLTRLRPDEPTWTWNPWNTPSKSKESAARFTCADFAFIHPGTVAPPELMRALPQVAARGPPAARASLDALAAWGAGDLQKPPRAAAAVFVAYNPSPFDKERMSSEEMQVMRVAGLQQGAVAVQGERTGGEEGAVATRCLQPACRLTAPPLLPPPPPPSFSARQAFEELTAEAKRQADAGAAGHEFSEADARRALNHTLLWLATGREANAKKAVEILDAWWAAGGGVVAVGRGQRQGPPSACGRAGQPLPSPPPHWALPQATTHADADLPSQSSRPGQPSAAPSAPPTPTARSRRPGGSQRWRAPPSCSSTAARRGGGPVWSGASAALWRPCCCPTCSTGTT
jgi:hypothetical protein